MPQRHGILLTVMLLVIGAMALWTARWRTETATGPEALQRKQLPIEPFGDSRSYGLYTWEGSLDQRPVVSMESSELYRRVFALTQMAAAGHEYVLIALVDLRQVAFSVNGTSARQYRFHMEPNGSVELPLELHLDPGRHEVILLLFKDPLPLPNRAEMRPPEGIAAQVRQIVVVGAAGRSAPSTDTEPLFWADGLPLSGLLVTEQPDATQYWTSARAKRGAPLSLYARVGNGEPTEAPFDLLLFVNWEQVDLGPTGAVLSGSVPPGRIGTWHLQMTAPEQAGVHEVQAVLIPRIGEPRLDAPRIEGSFRLHVDVD